MLSGLGIYFQGECIRGFMSLLRRRRRVILGKNNFLKEIKMCRTTFCWIGNLLCLYPLIKGANILAKL